MEWTKKNWKWSADFLMGKQLKDSRIGILGMGRIGRAVANIVRSFGMKIHYHNRSRLDKNLEKDAMALIIEHGFDHLLVDLPSIDRAYDEGRLECHRLFWGLPQGSHDLDGIEPSHRTITELSFVPNDIKDGNYLLQLQITNFIRDAAPSRPLLFSIVEK